MRAVYRNEIVFSVLVDPHCSWTSRPCVTPSTERITCAGPSKSSFSSSKRKSGPSCETCNFGPCARHAFLLLRNGRCDCLSLMRTWIVSVRSRGGINPKFKQFAPGQHRLLERQPGDGVQNSVRYLQIGCPNGRFDCAGPAYFDLRRLFARPSLILRSGIGNGTKKRNTVTHTRTLPSSYRSRLTPQWKTARFNRASQFAPCSRRR